MHRFSRLAATTILVIVLLPGQAAAGPYSDDLAKCLVESTTTEDRVELVKWMFAAASAHPAVQPMTSVTEEQLEAANKRMGDLIMRLLTESCTEATRKALQYEGAATFETSFQVLGQVAGKELFGSPEVAEALSGLDKYVDEEKLQALTAREPTPGPR